MSPINRIYKAGSIIYFTGDAAESVFILQNGLVSLSYLSPETQMEVRETIKNGEFFGVKSALGRFPREETAQVIKDAQTMVFTVPEFEALAAHNHKLVMKMLAIFSNQLRRIGKNIQMMLDSGDSGLPGEGLFRIGEYYLKNKNFTQARHAYEKYLQYYRDGEFATQCQQRIEMAKSGAATGYAIAKDGTSFLDSAAPAAAAPAPEPVPATTLEGSGIDAAKRYYQAFSLFSQNRLQDACKIYQGILDESGNSLDDYIEKTLFDIGRCLIALGRPDEAVVRFTELVQKFPQTQNLKKALYHIGEAYAKMNEPQKATSFFKKVQGMPPNEPVNQQAAEALSRLGGA
jgi:CRP-like cAMP-binding protein